MQVALFGRCLRVCSRACHVADIPVINALSDMAHPLQALADYMILQETFQVLVALWALFARLFAHARAPA